MGNSGGLRGAPHLEPVGEGVPLGGGRQQAAGLCALLRGNSERVVCVRAAAVYRRGEARDELPYGKEPLPLPGRHSRLRCPRSGQSQCIDSTSTRFERQLIARSNLFGFLACSVIPVHSRKSCSFHFKSLFIAT